MYGPILTIRVQNVIAGPIDDIMPPSSFADFAELITAIFKIKNQNFN